MYKIMIKRKENILVVIMLVYSIISFVLFLTVLEEFNYKTIFALIGFNLSLLMTVIFLMKCVKTNK